MDTIKSLLEEFKNIELPLAQKRIPQYHAKKITVLEEILTTVKILIKKETHLEKKAQRALNGNNSNSSNNHTAKRKRNQ